MLTIFAGIGDLLLLIKQSQYLRARLLHCCSVNDNTMQWWVLNVSTEAPFANTHITSNYRVDTGEVLLVDPERVVQRVAIFCFRTLIVPLRISQTLFWLQLSKMETSLKFLDLPLHCGTHIQQDTKMVIILIGNTNQRAINYIVGSYSGSSAFYDMLVAFLRKQRLSYSTTITM